MLGLFVGTYGTLIGAGGGFVLVPILLLLDPEETAVITSISPAVVCLGIDLAAAGLPNGHAGRGLLAGDDRPAAAFARRFSASSLLRREGRL